MCFLGFDWQLDDMACFLTNNRSINILTADTTFNLGDFFITPLTYPHPLLQDVKTGKPPVMLGLLLVHQKMDFAAFNYFASSLIGIKKELKNILAFGTDGDKALVEAFTHNFPFAIQLCCFVHFKNNVHEKLKCLGLSARICEEFISDIFGKRVGNTYQEGLVDSSSVEEVDDRLHRFQPIWDARELSDAPVSGPRFYKYFCQYQADVVK